MFFKADGAFISSLEIEVVTLAESWRMQSGDLKRRRPGSRPSTAKC
jgi:hypothetical protein